MDDLAEMLRSQSRQRTIEPEHGLMLMAADAIERLGRRCRLAEGELDALSASHRDLAKRLAKAGASEIADQ